MEAQWSPQWSLNGRHWSSKGGTMVVQGRQTSRSNWNTMFALLTGRPMADHCASILRPRRCACLHPASFERPVSDRPPRRPLCDCFEHAQNFTATMASMAMPERPVYHPWTTKATVLPPFCLQRRPGQFCGRTREAQRSQPLCKGGITDAYMRHHGSMRYYTGERFIVTWCYIKHDNYPIYKVQLSYLGASNKGRRAYCIVSNCDDNASYQPPTAELLTFSDEIFAIFADALGAWYWRYQEKWALAASWTHVNTNGMKIYKVVYIFKDFQVVAFKIKLIIPSFL